MRSNEVLVGKFKCASKFENRTNSYGNGPCKKSCSIPVGLFFIDHERLILFDSCMKWLHGFTGILKDILQDELQESNRAHSGVAAACDPAPPAPFPGRGPAGWQDVAVLEHLQRLGAGVRRQSAGDAGTKLAPRGAGVYPLPAAARSRADQRHPGREERD